MKPLHALRVKLETKSPRKTKLAQVVETNTIINRSGAKESLGFRVTKRSWWANSHWLGRQSKTLPRSKCFNYDNNEHLVKDCPKPPWVSDYVAQGKLILQGGFMDEIGAHKIVDCLLDLRTTNSFMNLQVAKRLESKPN
jgi:hypothetical protein